MNMDSSITALKDFIIGTSGKMTREASGILRYPYIVPSASDSPYYSNTLWDWDAWLTSIMLGQVEEYTGQAGQFADYERGSILNFLALCTEDGRMPICVTPDKPLTVRHKDSPDAETNMHKPVLAQQLAALCQRGGGDVAWALPHLDKLRAFLNRYMTAQRNEETGLLFWIDDYAVGVDNDPAVFYKPDRSCGSIYLNCLMVRELEAMGYLMEQAGDMREANAWRGKAQTLADAINRYCWDERDGTYYSVDFGLRPVDPGAWLHSGAPRDYPCLIMRLDSWSSFLPLWAGIASPEQARRMVERLRDPRTFACRGGVRTLSRLERMYDIRATNNPSNWRGPVWGISNFMVFSGLLKYGYTEDAQELAHKTIQLFGRDLEVNGCLHEYYHPDTGMPIVTHGFQNWNFLVLNMIAWLEGRRFMDTF